MSHGEETPRCFTLRRSCPSRILRQSALPVFGGGHCKKGTSTCTDTTTLIEELSNSQRVV